MKEKIKILTKNKKLEKLQVGDVFEVANSFKFYGDIPKKFVYLNIRKNSKDANEMTKHVLKCGVTYQIEEEPEETFSVTKEYSGKYVVVKTEMTGGGTGHGPHDIYPDGHCVTAKRLHKDSIYDINGKEIHFYQSGCFTVVNKNVPIVGKMQMLFVPVKMCKYPGCSNYTEDAIEYCTNGCAFDHKDYKKLNNIKKKEKGK